ncbi:hypothetical protein [Roseovarius pacificus]|uniref:hypothetical protein n=1 Tax=Roseovarius pacificus TaxID=337701 RepID=UPI00296A3F15|nr:hypothetical protein [Roseovarius pacificus]MDW3117721.1 hypothetical protein [Roseovarius pacificus]
MSHEVDLAAVNAERRHYFKPRWFVDLLSARLSVGDTFWIGGYGTALIFVPVGFVMLLVARIFLSAPQVANMLGILITFMALFHVALLTAVFRTALHNPQVSAWRWVGVLITLANATTMALLTYTFWFEGTMPLPGLLH